jgi:hypothetical protein
MLLDCDLAIYTDAIPVFPFLVQIAYPDWNPNPLSRNTNPATCGRE